MKQSLCGNGKFTGGRRILVASRFQKRKLYTAFKRLHQYGSGNVKVIIEVGKVTGRP
jgi:hypothetical protein